VIKFHGISMPEGAALSWPLSDIVIRRKNGFDFRCRVRGCSLLDQRPVSAHRRHPTSSGRGSAFHLLSHSARVISVSSLFAKLPQRDVMQTPADLCSRRGDLQFRAPDNQRDAPGPTARHPFIQKRLRWPPARGRGLARGVAGRAGGGGCARGRRDAINAENAKPNADMIQRAPRGGWGNEIGCPNLMHY
jgi:hypothetical protein